MSQTVKKEVLPRFRQRYITRGPKGKTALINELCELGDYSRKHAIKLLNGQDGCGTSSTRKRGRPSLYDQKVKAILLKLWKTAEQPCGKRLAAMIELWLPHYENAHGELTKKTRDQLLKISPAQIDRLLAKHKVIRGRCGTKPGGILKTQIPIRTDNWDVAQPGFLEADTVAHCGGSWIWGQDLGSVFNFQFII